MKLFFSIAPAPKINTEQALEGGQKHLIFQIYFQLHSFHTVRIL